MSRSFIGVCWPDEETFEPCQLPGENSRSMSASVRP